MKTAKTIAQQQSIDEVSIEMLDQIYYEGYTEELMASDPLKFEWELKEFQSLFSKKHN